LTVKGAAGVDKIRFDGKLSSGRKLSSGTYKVTFVATVDGISSPTRTRKFTIIKG
jgi:flagellar hook assembly protein FlgD